MRTYKLRVNLAADANVNEAVVLQYNSKTQTGKKIRWQK
jgi:hypothetical protein